MHNRVGESIRYCTSARDLMGPYELLLAALRPEGYYARSSKGSRVAKTLLTPSSGFVTTARRVLHSLAKRIEFNPTGPPPKASLF